MSWIDYKNFSHYNQLEQLCLIGIREYQKYLDRDVKQISEDIVKRYSHIPWPDNVDWHIHPLIKGKEIHPVYQQYWPETVHFANNIPGLNSLNVNFVDPNSIIPDHRDDMPMLKDYEDWRKELGYITVVGIAVPGNSIDECGFHVGGIKKQIKTGDIMTFDGSEVHGGWNYTNERRVTFYLSINKNYYAMV